MTETEDRVRELLRDLAEDVQAAPLLARLDRQSSTLRRRRRLVAAATAAAVAAAALVTVVVTGRYQDTTQPLPSDRPPKVFRLSGQTSTRPGVASMAVVLTGPGGTPAGHGSEKPVYLQPAKGGGRSVHLSRSSLVPTAWSQHLSADGTRLVRQNDEFLHPRIEVVNLVTGRSSDLGGLLGYCPQFSPDNTSIVLYDGDEVRLIDVRSRSSVRIRKLAVTADDSCEGIAWSPDGTALWVREKGRSVLVDLHGRVLRRVPNAYVTNSSMSFSPDGRSTLMYAGLQGRFMAVPTDGGPLVVLPRPPDGDKPLGWAGSRVVWLAGQPGAQRLVTTDRRGGDVRPWMRFDVGDQPVESVSWSRALSG